jgi:hypothetical protein
MSNKELQFRHPRSNIFHAARSVVPAFSYTNKTSTVTPVAATASRSLRHPWLRGVPAWPSVANRSRRRSDI